MLRGGVWIAGIAIAIAMLAFPAHANSGSPNEPGSSLGVRLLDVPEAAQADPRAKLYVIDHVSPGTTIQRRIEVSHSGTSPAHVRVYAAAAKIVDGAFLPDDADTSNSLVTWTTVRPSQVDLPGGSTEIATVTIEVPARAESAEQYAVVWAEVASTGDGALKSVNRVGIRIYLSVGPGGDPVSELTIDAVTAKRTVAGQPIVIAEVSNTGGRALDLTGSLVLSNGPAGLSGGPYPAVLGTTLSPGQTEGLSFALGEQVPNGPWDALITVRSGLLEESVEASITFPDVGAGPRSPVGGGFWWWLAALLGAVALGVAIWAKMIRRRHALNPGDDDGYTHLIA